MISEKKKFIFSSLRVLYQNEDLSNLLDKNKYDLITVISYRDLGLERRGFRVKRKKLANIYLDAPADEILQRFARNTRQEIQQTYELDGLRITVGDKNDDAVYNLYADFERAQGRAPWGKDSFDGVVNFNAYYRGELIASVPCYDIFPYLQVRAMFSKRLVVEDKNLQKVIGKATRRLIFEACKYGQERGYLFVGLGSVNYSTEQKSHVADFKMFFSPKVDDEYTYIYESRRYHWLQKLKSIFRR